MLLVVYVHVLVLAEGYSDETGLKKFEKDWHGKEYANGKAKLRVREMKIYTLAVNEVGREELLAELKDLTGGYSAMGGNCDTRDGNFNWGKMMKWIRTMAGIVGVKPVKDENIKPKPVGIRAGKDGWNCHFAIIGEVNDPRNNVGTEQV